MKRVLRWAGSAWRMMGPGLLFGLLGGVIIWEFLWLRVVEKASTLDILNFVVLLALVLVTLGYTIGTNRIARATEGSVAEAVKQRYLSTQPWVFPRLLSLVNHPTENIDMAMPLAPSFVPFVNIGKGPAIDLKPFVSNETEPVNKRRIEQIQNDYKKSTLVWANSRSGPTWPFLLEGQSPIWPEAFRSPKRGEFGIIAVEYKDIYGREFLSGWAFQISEVENQRLAVIPGEPLYPVERRTV